MWPANKLGSFKVPAKHRVSSKDGEEKLPQTLHRASHSSGRSPRSRGKHFCPLSFSLIGCPVPKASEVPSPPQELTGDTRQARPETGINCARLEHRPGKTPSARYPAVGKVLQVQESCSSTNSNFPRRRKEDPGTQQCEKDQGRGPAGG